MSYFCCDNKVFQLQRLKVKNPRHGFLRFQNWSWAILERARKVREMPGTAHGRKEKQCICDHTMAASCRCSSLQIFLPRFWGMLLTHGQGWIGIHFVAQANRQLATVLLQTLEYWDNRSMISCLALSFLFIWMASVHVSIHPVKGILLASKF